MFDCLRDVAAFGSVVLFSLTLLVWSDVLLSVL